MSIDNLDLLPKAPNAAYVQIVAALIRGFIQIVSGLGFGWGVFVSGDQITMAATALVMLGTLLWSAWQKLQAERHKQHAAVASALKSAQATAAAGEPVAIPVLDPKKG